MAATQKLISDAVEYILGNDDIYMPESISDRFFQAGIIGQIYEMLTRYGCPTDEMLKMSREIGALSREDCSDHSSLEILWHPISLRHIAMDMHTATEPPVDYWMTPAFVGQCNGFNVCQAFPAFMAGIHKVHSAGIIPNAILVRVEEYRIFAFGF